MKFQNLKLEKEREREYLRHGGSMGVVLREEVVWVANLGVRVSDFESFRVSEWVSEWVSHWVWEGRVSESESESVECLRVQISGFKWSKMCL